MSDLLNSASLVMIPSGYKEDVVYSQIPTNGSGDLSFTRASNGTRINSAGLVEVCPWNLLTYSNDFSSSWALIEASKSTGVTDPIGNANAIKLKYTTATSGHYITQGISLTGSNAHSVYAKAGELQFLQIASAQSINEYANFNLSTGVIGTYGSYASNVQIENVGNGWYRCSVVFTNGTNGIYLAIVQSASSDWFGISTYAGANSTNGLYLYGGQVNAGTLKPYFPTTDRLNVPRLTYQNGGGGCPSLLLEKQSTNVFSYSQELDNGFWTPLQITITANNTTSPDGTQNADKITEDAVNGVHLFYNTSAVTGSATSTASIFYKKGTRRYFSVKLQIGSNSYTQVFDADGVTTGSNSSNGLTSVSTSIVSMGNGWVRASVTGTDPSASTACYMICSLSNSATPTFDSGNFNPSYSGSTSEYGFFWGAQLEASSYATSYIPTTSSSATRVADVFFEESSSPLIGQTEGTLFAQFKSLTSGASGASRISISSGTNANWIFVGTEANNLRGYIRANSTVILSDTTIPTSGNDKIAIAYKSGNMALYINGTQIATSSNSFTFSATLDDISTGVAGSYQVDDTILINQLVIFPTRLTNAELASLTTL